MPTNQIKKDSRSGKGSTKSLENKWNDAKKIVKDEYGSPDDHWGVVEKIYQNKRDASTLDVGHEFGPKRRKTHQASVSIVTGAASRLRATADPDDGASPDPRKYEQDVWNMEGYNSEYASTEAPIQGPETRTELQQWLASAKIPHKINPGSAFAYVKGTPAEVTKALVAAGWIVDPKTKHLKCEDHELYVSQPPDQQMTIVTDLGSQHLDSK